MKLEDILKEKVLIIDGAMGTQIQNFDLKSEDFGGYDGCNEFLLKSKPEVIESIHKSYLAVGANIIKTNTFGTIPWVLDEFGLGKQTYELSFLGAKILKELCVQFDCDENPRFCAGAIGPGTKLPSLGHIGYDEMFEGYKIAALGLIDGGCDLFLLETCQDPLQIKAAIHACEAAMAEKNIKLPIMVSVTIELSGAMLIGTDVATIVAILEPFEIVSLGFNCGTGPGQYGRHVKKLSQLWDRPISVHANAGLPQNRGGYTFYPMGPKEFTQMQLEFLENDGVAMLGGCCGTTPQHIKALAQEVKGIRPKKPTGNQPKSLASLFETRTIKQEPAPFLIGERSNATGSKAFRDLLLAEDYEGTLSVAQEQVRSGAHGIDLSVGFAGRDESKDMAILSHLYGQKVSLPLMIDSTQIKALEIALKNVGGKPIVNSVNLEDGIEKFDQICSLAKKFGASLVCLAIDEEGMAKTKERKLLVARRILERAVNIHRFHPGDLVFDLLTFTVGSGDEEYFDAAIQTIEAIRDFSVQNPDVGFVLGVSNISFGLDKHAREYLNSVFLNLCVEAGLSMAIVNVKNTIPLHKISQADKKACEDLLLNNRSDGDPLFKFIDHFAGVKVEKKDDDAQLAKLSTKEKLTKFLIDGDKERMLKLLPVAKDEIEAEKIINEVLIEAMKEVGELFGSGKMQLPFVLQSAETMKSSVEFLKPFLPKKAKETKMTLVLGTVKGDVHDVGKNLVDIILTNNGFKVVNIGIKADLDDFLKACKEHNADAVGMSGLLVKSTQVMMENLQKMKELGLKIPVLLGGAALNRKFINEFCRPNYEGEVIFCRDAFDAIGVMGAIEKGELGAFQAKNSLLRDDVELADGGLNGDDGAKEGGNLVDPSKIILPQEVSVPTPPFWGRRQLKADVKDLAYKWINKKVLFNSRWGYSVKGLDTAGRENQKNELEALFDEIKREIEQNNLFEPVTLYGYYPCRSDGEALLIFDEGEGWSDENSVNKEPLNQVMGRASDVLEFPRQRKEPHRSLSDFFHSNRHDVVAFTCVSAGSRFSEYEKKLYEAGDFKKYYLVHGLSVDLAEALAEIVHKQIRLELGIAQNEGDTIRDVKMVGYTGCRYSFGYAACPDLSQSQTIFRLLKPEEFGIVLSQTYQIHPEQSTTSLVVYHKDANYFAI